MSLNFPITCPKIDKQIDNIKSIIEQFLEYKIEEISPLMSRENVVNLRSMWTDELCSEIEPAIENIRETNVDMRNQADKQIDELEAEISELKEVNNNLEDIINNLEDK